MKGCSREKSGGRGAQAEGASRAKSVRFEQASVFVSVLVWLGWREKVRVLGLCGALWFIWRNFAFMLSEMGNSESFEQKSGMTSLAS